MKVNLKKIGAIVAGATILASSAAFAGLMFQSTTLVDSNGAPMAKVILGSHAQPSDGVAAALIASKIASEAYKSQTLTASTSGTASCTGGSGEGTGTCSITNEKVTLEITVPGTVAAGTWTGDNLIGDFLNRELLDRHRDVADDSDSDYPLSTSDTSPNANPFTDGTSSGNIGSTETSLLRVSGTEFSPFADATLTDDDSSNTYVEKQYLWVHGDNRYDADPKEIVGTLDFLAYSLKFDGPGGSSSGIPVCTTPENHDYSACKENATDTTTDDATETHRLKIWFLGEEWVISEMDASDCTTAVTNENTLTNCGSVKLAKEAVNGILNQGDSLPVENLKFQLDDLEAHGDTTSAIISVLDANGNVLKKDKVAPGSTKELSVAGKTYRFHVYKVAPGYTFGAKWADVAVYSEELELVDASELNEDENNNEGYKVALGWKNYDASSTYDDADTLRTIVIYTDDVTSITSSGTDSLEEADYANIVVDPSVWKLTYKGLDLSDNDTETLKFQLKTTSTLKISHDDGPDIDSDSTREACWVFAPYMLVTSGKSGSVFTVDGSFSAGELSDDQFVVALNSGSRTDVVSSSNSTQNYESDTSRAALCDRVDGDGIIDASDTWLPAGSVFMRISHGSSYYGVVNYTATSSTYNQGVTVGYSDIGDGDTGFVPTQGGAILVQSISDVNTQLTGDGSSENRLADLLQSAYGNRSSVSDGTFLFAIAEKAGEGTSSDFVDYYVFGVDGTDTSSASDATFDYDSTLDSSTSYPVTSDAEDLLYGHATPIDAITTYASGVGEFYNYTNSTDGYTQDPTGPVQHGIEMVDEGYISERGSKFKTIDDDQVEFAMAHQLAHAQWFLAASSTSAASASTSVVTLSEGASTEVGGVTVKVVEITETVGACSAGTGSVACTADMSGVSAVIMPNNAASVDVAVPYTGDYGSLVKLDSEAQDVGTLISVGGDKVNTVTANLLQGAAIDWSVPDNRKVVKEVVQGSKIVVAGKEAADTLEAAQDFIAALKKV